MSSIPETTAFAGQPIVEVERDGVRYTLLGTAHVSKTSIEAVRAAIDSGRFDAVAVELDEQRHKALTDTLERAGHYGKMARDALALFPDSAVQRAFLDVVDFSIERAF